MSIELILEPNHDRLAPVRFKRPKRILHVINGEHFSGAERVQDLLALNLPDFGYEVGFACLKPNRFPRLRAAQAAPLYEVQMRSRFDRQCANRIAAIVERDRYHLVHAHTPRTLMVGRWVARRMGLPLVYHVHSPVGRDSTRGLMNRLNQWIETRNVREVDRMICVSQSIAKYMNSLGHDSRKITVVPNGVPRSEETRVRTRQKHWTIGTVALFRPRKGIEVLLDAIAALKQRGLPVSLLAVGPFETPDYKTEVMNRVERLKIADSVTWTGFCKDVNAQLLEMDLFVLPSLFGEGLPMVVLEAMAAGLPTIAARVEGIPEAIRSGLDGLIFEPSDSQDLAAKVESLIGGQYDWNSMSRSAQARQREVFSDTSMARGVADVYSELLVGKK